MNAQGAYALLRVIYNRTFRPSVTVRTARSQHDCVLDLEVNIVVALGTGQQTAADQWHPLYGSNYVVRLLLLSGDFSAPGRSPLSGVGTEATVRVLCRLPETGSRTESAGAAVAERLWGVGSLPASDGPVLHTAELCVGRAPTDSPPCDVRLGGICPSLAGKDAHTP